MPVETVVGVVPELPQAPAAQADDKTGDPSQSRPRPRPNMFKPASTVLLTTMVLATTVVQRSADAQLPVEEPPAVVDSSNGLPIGVPETVEGVHGEPLNRFDVRYPWAHGYIQEMPAYGGFGAFRPYNYKHVLSQSQAAGGWGMSPTMPYAQQFWHRYRKRALMMPEPTYSQLRPKTGVVPASRR